MNEIIQCILNRRSHRVFSPDPIDDATIDLIVQAGLYAPSASNDQSWHLTVVRNADILNKISDASKEIVKANGEGYVVNMANNEKFHTFYNAPVAIIVSGEENATAPQVDCAAASENMVIAAESLHIGSCWVGFISFLFNSDQVHEYKELLGIPEGYQPYYAIALGHKKNEHLNAPARREGTVNYI